MLRNFTHKPDSTLLEQTLQQFDISFPDKQPYFTLLEFKVISPDSFMWQLLINKSIYYLYAEDFVGGLKDVQNKILTIAKTLPHLEFVPAKIVKNFHETQPVRSATIYATPDRVKEMMRFAVDSGPDFVFLCRSDEDSAQALFT